MAHTPGPWDEDDGNVFSRPLADARTNAIVAKLDGKPYDKAALDLDAFVCTTEQRHDTSDDDATLIAAAPCLLAACKAALVELEQWGTCFDKEATCAVIAKAIAKATGGSDG